MLLTTLDPPPPGFQIVALSKRDLLSGPVAVLVSDVDQIVRLLPDYGGRMIGIIVMLSDGFHLECKSALLWEAYLPATSLTLAAPILQGWLEAIGAADEARQRHLAAEFRVERVGRELDVTRQDYNRLTTRLQAQVQDLLAAKAELSALNEHLEARVVKRTDELAHTNSQLSAALEELKQAQDEIIRTTELAGLGALVAGVAHELNTPIGNALTVSTSLSGATQMLKMQLDDGTLRRSALEQHVENALQMTEILERNLQRAANLVDKFKQITSDQIREERRWFLLNELVEDALVQMRSFLFETPYCLHAEVEPGIRMYSYPGAIVRILSHLVLNAVTHAFEGRAQGAMHLRAGRIAGDCVELALEDDGKGIAEKDISRVFNPFFTTKLGHGGSGLGLYVAYNEAQKLLGGRLSVSSTLGAGSCFRLQIPLGSSIAEMSGTGT